MTLNYKLDSVLHKKWYAQLDLGFAFSNGRTIFSHREHCGPLQIQKPFYPEKNGIIHVYILHPPGGIVGGDCLKLNIKLNENAHSLITTPAAGKFYRSSGSIASQIQIIKVASGGILEWFPSENIIFSGANARLKTRIDLAIGGNFIGWDIFCLGRPHSRECFDNGFFNQRLEVFRNGVPLRMENLNLQGKSDALNAKWGLMGYPVSGNMICATEKTDIVNSIRNMESVSSKNGIFSVTNTDGIILCRFLGNSVERAKEIFIKAWKIFRSSVIGLNAVEPRIWKT